MSLPTKQYANIAFSAEFVASMLDSEGNAKAAQLIRSLAEQRAELLEALQKLHSVAIGSVELDDWRELQDALDCAMQAITRAEATE